MRDVIPLVQPQMPTGLHGSEFPANTGLYVFGLKQRRIDKWLNLTERRNTLMATLSERALGILHEWVQSESLRRHCYAVADSMRHFAQLSLTDADKWEAVGLLHDMDYERHPNQEQSATEGHPFVGVKWLRANGWNEEICHAILSHADYAHVARETSLEKTLYAVDELSGFVTAVARVRPSKSIRDVNVAAVKKKMKDKAFARAVSREDIIRGAEELGMPLDDVIANVITALQADAERLGLVGTTAS
jgi:putative nucleotidyltransferase with HDIG domain